MIDEAEKVLRLHTQWVDEHRNAMRNANRRLMAYLIYCGIVTASSLLFILAPPFGLKPAEGPHMPGETVFWLIVLGATIVSLFALLAWLEMLLKRQAQHAADLVSISFEMGRQVGKSSFSSS